MLIGETYTPECPMPDDVYVHFCIGIGFKLELYSLMHKNMLDLPGDLWLGFGV